MESEATNVLTDQEAQYLFHVLDNIEGGILRVSLTASPYHKVRTRWTSVTLISSFSMHYQYSYGRSQMFS